MSIATRGNTENTYYKPVRKYKQRESWLKHCSFGLIVSTRLLLTALALLLNSLVPFIPIPKMFRIHDTSNWLSLKSWVRRQDRMKYLR